MNAFLRMFAGLVLGALHGYDRLVFRGTLRHIAYPKGLCRYLDSRSIKLVDFAQHSQQLTRTLLDASEQQAHQARRPIRYLNSPQRRKEDIARTIAQQDQIHQGLICVLKCVEPCLSFEVHRNRQARKLQLRSALRKCLHLYHYYQHPALGLLHVRLQSWLPFGVRVCLNGREWLARQMDQAGLAYQRRDNCFTWVEDVAAAQRLFDEQLRADWPALLDGLLGQAHPAHAQLLGGPAPGYYWSAYQSEWASDVLFGRRTDLQAWYPRWVRHAITTYQGGEVMRFLGRRVPQTGQVHGKFAGEVTSDLGRRVEGLRIKHRVNENSIKMYDKGSVLRIETTINRPEEFKVYRSKEGEPDGPQEWRSLRRGVADLARRAEVSQQANERYAEALTAVAETTTVAELAGKVCERTREVGGKSRRKVRGLNPLSSSDAALLEAVSRPEFVVNGLRNRDLVGLLYGRPASDEKERKRRSSAVTRQIRLLRAHGLLRKVAKSHRYQVTARGRKTLTALLAARDASVETLTANAA
jgi:hypothetical protein